MPLPIACPRCSRPTVTHCPDRATPCGWWVCTNRGCPVDRIAVEADDAS